MSHEVDRVARWRRLVAEALGTGLLVTAVVGSGIMAQRLSPEQTGLELLENAVATAAALFVLVAVLGPVSGAQLNPVVTAADAWFGGLSRRDVVPYWAAQLAGGCAGAVLANLMFDLPAVELSTTTRSGAGILLSEVVATAGLLVVVFGLVRQGRGRWVPGAVAAYIGAAYWFTASTSFANPAVTVARSLTDTFAGIAPASVGPFVVAQVVGAVVAVLVVRALWPRVSDVDAEVIDVHRESR